MFWTALHTVLGEDRPGLSFTMILRACEAGVEERSDLDWKAQLPLTASDAEGKQTQQAELAKDIAAMANSGGGLIVHGVRQIVDPNSSAADVVEPVGQVSEADLQQIRQVAGSLIYPPVVGLQLLKLAPEENPASGVLALHVPDSQAAPHLVHPARRQSEYFIAPWRDGPHTSRMVERQIASAYLLREQGARRRRQEFEDLWLSAVRVATKPGPAGTAAPPVWVIAVAAPDQPYPRPRNLMIDKADSVFASARSFKGLAAYGALDLVKAEQTRRGLRRYFRVGERHLRGNVTPCARVEVHTDGAITVAVTRDGAFPGESRVDQQVAIPDIEQVGLDLYALLSVWQKHTGHLTNYSARIGISRPTEQFRRADPTVGGHFVPFNEQHRVPDYQPVDGPILAASDSHTARLSCLDVIRDAVNQAGVETHVQVDHLTV